MLPSAGPAVVHLIEDVARGLEDDLLHAEPVGQLRDANRGQARHVGLSVHERSQLREHRGVAGLDVERRDLGRIEGQPRHVRVLDPYEVRPGDLELSLFPNGFDLAFRRRGRGDDLIAAFVGKKGEWDTEDVDVFRLEESFRSHLVRGTSEAPAHDLLAQELARESAQPHDVGDGLRVPASESIPTEITFWMYSPGFPGSPTVSTICRKRSACSCFVNLRTGASSPPSASSS